jgi:hypothetical protein
LRSLGWQVDLLWIPRTQNEECDALSKGAFAGIGVLQEIHEAIHLFSASPNLFPLNDVAG